MLQDVILSHNMLCGVVLDNSEQIFLVLFLYSHSLIQENSVWNRPRQHKTTCYGIVMSSRNMFCDFVLNNSGQIFSIQHHETGCYTITQYTVWPCPKWFRTNFSQIFIFYIYPCFQQWWINVTSGNSKTHCSTVCQVIEIGK